MPDTCCQTTEDGSAICLTAQSGTAACQCAPSQATLSPDSIPIPKSSKTSGLKSIIAFGVACLTSPCCTPLIVPVLLALFVGTPFAVWMSNHLGLIYGALTLISVLSFGLALRWTQSSPRAHQTRMRKLQEQLKA